MKKTILVFGVITVLMLASVGAVYGTNINVNSTDVTFTEATGYPYLDANNRTQVPLRVAMEQAGAKVTWDQNSKVATVEKRGTVVQVPIGANYIIVDGKQVPTDTSAIIKNGKTYLPIRPVLEAVDFGVEWDSDTQTVFAANFLDYLADEEIVLEEKRQNINTAADLLDYLVSKYRLEHDKDAALQLAEREYFDKLNEDPVHIISYFEWYNEDQLEDEGIDLDKTSFSIDVDEDFNYTYEGEIVLEGNGKSVTINIPEFTVYTNYNPDDDDDTERVSSKTFDGLTINFSFSKLEFKGEDLANLGLIN